MKYVTDFQFWLGWLVVSLVLGFVLNLMRKA
jgi:hypothetical protein